MQHIHRFIRSLITELPLHGLPGENRHTETYGARCTFSQVYFIYLFSQNLAALHSARDEEVSALSSKPGAAEQNAE